VGSKVSVADVGAVVLVVVVDVLVVLLEVEVLDEVEELVSGTLLVVGCAPLGPMPNAKDETTTKVPRSVPAEILGSFFRSNPVAVSGRRREQDTPNTFRVPR
jgi:hypothetical protein